MSTVDVDTVDAVFQAFTEKGIAFGDAPVGRLAAHADKGESLFMLGIDEKHLPQVRSEEHTSELQSLMRISYAVFCLKKKNTYSYTATRLTNVRGTTLIQT